MKYFLHFAENRLSWFLVFASCLLFEACALYFQYGLALEPCIKCIYQRLAILAIGLSALPALIQPKSSLMRLISFSGIFFFSAWGYKIAADHVAVQNAPNPLFAVCDTVPDFPSWFNPHIWLPDVFEPRGFCGDIAWQFLTLSMPEWMKVLFAGYITIIGCFLLIRLFKLRTF